MKVTAGREFTPQQQQWLDYIRAHLVQSLSIDEHDFDDIPVFSRHGGWGPANRDFDGQLPELIQHFNEAIAA